MEPEKLRAAPSAEAQRQSVEPLFTGNSEFGDDRMSTGRPAQSLAFPCCTCIMRNCQGTHNSLQYSDEQQPIVYQGIYLLLSFDCMEPSVPSSKLAMQEGYSSKDLLIALQVLCLKMRCWLLPQMPSCLG